MRGDLISEKLLDKVAQHRVVRGQGHEFGRLSLGFEVNFAPNATTWRIRECPQLEHLGSVSDTMYSLVLSHSHMFDFDLVALLLGARRLQVGSEPCTGVPSKPSAGE
jgi:hypothetical protein